MHACLPAADTLKRRLLAGGRLELAFAACPALETLDLQYCALPPGAPARLRARLPYLRSVRSDADGSV